MDEANLELIIDGEEWNVIIVNDTKPEKYWMVNLYEKTLWIHNLDVNQVKYSCWLNYHKE